ncbi:acylneuraminate cytidylyltransferase [Paenibacillus sp. Soil766]|uniref:cytidylyltransferase domain-containing protein n=1 Tax=Paenibacillus sp. Soil766 TaxID=1736404 RepID=UPI0007111E1B|nr:glycosyltransferase family protein [Paenibacillus sp. Soil766]KRE97947.1 acylneuraminate cytidylyltransferase [Paenibacillus sp. Soil766]
MKTVAIIQARMGSTRLPGKVLKRLEDDTVLGHVVHRLQAVDNIDEIVVATTTNSEDDVIESKMNTYGIKVYRGNEQNVLSRYYEAAVKAEADIIIRITSDCPLIDPDVTAAVIRFFHAENADYVSNSLERSFPRGLDTEVFLMSVLQKAFENAVSPEHLEHVTPYIYQNPHSFKLASYTNEIDYSSYRWTLDTQEDWELINEIYRRLYAKNSMFGWRQVIGLMKEYPELPMINAHVEQKKLGQ